MLLSGIKKINTHAHAHIHEYVYEYTHTQNNAQPSPYLVASVANQHGCFANTSIPNLRKTVMSKPDSLSYSMKKENTQQHRYRYTVFRMPFTVNTAQYVLAYPCRIYPTRPGQRAAFNTRSSITKIIPQKTSECACMHEYGLEPPPYSARKVQEQRYTR